MDKFKQRLLAATIAIFLSTLVVFYSHTPLLQLVFVLFSAATTHFALREYYHLAEIQGYHPLTSLAAACTFLYAFSVYLGTQSPSLATLPFITLYFFLLLGFLFFFKRGSHPIANLAITFFGIIYLTIPLSCAIQINYWPSLHSSFDGRVILAYVLMVTKATDIGAYFFGKSLGKIKLAPAISPKKTIEGSIGGWMTSLLVSLCFLPYLPFSFLQHLLIATAISAAAQCGDLAESLLKRDADIKDSGHLPGLGGMLDIVDSLVFTFPLMTLLLKLEVL